MTTASIPSANSGTQARSNTSSPKPVQGGRENVALTQVQQQKAELNISILESTQVSIGAKDQPLSLLLNTAIDKINESLAPELGDNAIQKALDSGLDVSPDATAERIVSLSTAFYTAFKEQHQGESESIALAKFLDTIGSGIDQGFKEARGILESLKVLDGEVASNIDETYNLVQDKLAAFEAMIMQQGAE